MNKKPTKSRLLTLLNLLIHETDEENPITVTEITSRLSAVGFSTADRKTIYKDIEILQAHGIDIICNRKIQNQYFIGSREFDLPELALLADAVQAAKFISTNGIQPVRNIFCGQVRGLTPLEGSALKLPRFFRSGLAGEMKNSELFSPPSHRLSHEKRVVAHQQCYVYPASISLTFFGRLLQLH